MVETETYNVYFVRTTNRIEDSDILSINANSDRNDDADLIVDHITSPVRHEYMYKLAKLIVNSHVEYLKRYEEDLTSFNLQLSFPQETTRLHRRSFIKKSFELSYEQQEEFDVLVDQAHLFLVTAE